MNRPDGSARAPRGRDAPLRRAFDPDQVGRALRPGVIVETDPATAQAWGPSRNTAWNPRTRSRLPRAPPISAIA